MVEANTYFSPSDSDSKPVSSTVLYVSVALALLVGVVTGGVVYAMCTRPTTYTDYKYSTTSYLLDTEEVVV